MNHRAAISAIYNHNFKLSTLDSRELELIYLDKRLRVLNRLARLSDTLYGKLYFIRRRREAERLRRSVLHGEHIADMLIPGVGVPAPAKALNYAPMDGAEI